MEVIFMTSIFLFMVYDIVYVGENMNVNNIQNNAINNVLNNKSKISKIYEIKNNSDIYKKTIKDDFNIDNPYNFKNIQEIPQSNNDYNGNIFQTLLFYSSLQQKPSLVEKEQVADNQKNMEKQVDKQLNDEKKQNHTQNFISFLNEK